MEQHYQLLPSQRHAVLRHNESVGN
jgi:hypothetical protein